MIEIAMSDCHLGKRQRLSDRKDFDNVFRRGRRSADRFFTVLYCNNNVGYARLGFAVSKKRVRRAVRRNRIRRLTRESFRIVKARLGGVDTVILAGKAAATAANDELFNSLQKHWRRMENHRAGTHNTDQ